MYTTIPTQSDTLFNCDRKKLADTGLYLKLIMSNRTETKRNTIRTGKVAFLIIMFVFLWIIMDDYFQIKQKILSISNFKTPHSNTLQETSFVLDACKFLVLKDNQTGSKIWVEDSALFEIPVSDHMTVSNASNSKFFILNQKHSYRLGEEIIVRVDLSDGYGHKKKSGGDMIHVWMREKVLNASCAARVIDNDNGSYTATVIAFWSGVPEIKVVLIHPKEVIETAFRRRFTCPQVLYQLAVFEHPIDSSIKEVTVCNMEEYIAGYNAICNLTNDNYGSPLYCGKPTNQRLQCNDWTRVGAKSTWPNKEPLLTPAERLLLQPENKATLLPGTISIEVKEAGPMKRLIESTRPCSELKTATVWNRSSPIGYFYDGIWYDRHCIRRHTYQNTTLNKCLVNRSMYLLGDSTLRQWHYVIQDRINCKFITDSWDESHKHRPATCVDRNLNFTLHWAPHGLPFATDNTPRRYFRPIVSNIDEIKGNNHFIIIINLFAHLMSFHSKLFYSKIYTIKNAIQRLYQRCPKATVAIKGPHFYSFEKQTYQSLWMLDKYAEIYTNIMRELFVDIMDRVIYLDGMDITISAETKHIHPSRETVVQMVDDMFSKICT